MIAIVCSTVFAVSETFITRHINELAPGRTVVVCFRRDNTEKLTCPTYIGDDVFSFMPWYRQELLKAWNLLRYSYTRVPSRREADRICSFLLKHKVKAILAEYGHLGCMIQPVAEKAGIPFFVYFRGDDASWVLRLWQIRHSYRTLLPRAKGLICVSRFLADNLRKIGLNHSNTHIIPSGVNVAKFTPKMNKDGKMVIAVGRFTEMKAPDQTIRAFASIAARHEGVSLEMIGDGPLLPGCQKLAADLGIADRVIFHGARGHDFVKDRMSAASIFVQHSVTTRRGDTEGLPVAVQEAMASGLAVVSTRHAGIPEAVLEDKTGFLVDEHDVEGMSLFMDKLLSNPALIDDMGRAGRDRAVELFSTFKSIPKIRRIMGLDCYQEVKDCAQD